MLLLVLILVLVAFGLLVVALLTGNVLCAWLSVAVSVAAAVVLVVDWLQRRSAEKAGRAGAEATQSTTLRTDASAGSRGSGDHDPVTEVLPVVAPGGARPEAGPDPAMAGGTRAEADSDAQRTVSLPSVQPSGSGGRPSGAEVFSTPSGGPSSQRVTTTPSSSVSGDDAYPLGDESRRAADSTVVVDVRKRPGTPLTSTDTTTTDTSRAEQRSTTGPDHAIAAGPDDRTSTSNTVGRTDVGSASAVTGAGVAGAAAATAAGAAEETSVASSRAGEPSSATHGASRATVTATRPGSEDGEAVTTRTVRERPVDEPGRAAPEPDEPTTRATSAPSTTESDDRSATVVTRVPGGAPSSEATTSVTYPTGTSADSGRGTFGGPVSTAGHELFDPIDRSGAEPPAAIEPPIGTAADGPPVQDDEPPEEQYDPAAARVVAALADQVLVVDEQPRYHVVGCRALVAQPTIPLPAREAVELGFTPCGWCTPDAVLGGQHRAGARP